MDVELIKLGEALEKAALTDPVMADVVRAIVGVQFAIGAKERTEEAPSDEGAPQGHFVEAPSVPDAVAPEIALREDPHSTLPEVSKELALEVGGELARGELASPDYAKLGDDEELTTRVEALEEELEEVSEVARRAETLFVPPEEPEDEWEADNADDTEHVYWGKVCSAWSTESPNTIEVNPCQEDGTEVDTGVARTVLLSTPTASEPPSCPLEVGDVIAFTRIGYTVPEDPEDPEDDKRWLWLRGHVRPTPIECDPRPGCGALMAFDQEGHLMGWWVLEPPSWDEFIWHSPWSIPEPPDPPVYGE